jgi:hypothetical protein
MTIAIIALAAFIVITGFLLWHGRFGQRNLVWTMRMGEENITRRYDTAWSRNDDENIAA